MTRAPQPTRWQPSRPGHALQGPAEHLARHPCPSLQRSLQHADPRAGLRLRHLARRRHAHRPCAGLRVHGADRRDDDPHRFRPGRQAGRRLRRRRAGSVQQHPPGGRFALQPRPGACPPSRRIWPPPAPASRRRRKCFLQRPTTSSRLPSAACACCAASEAAGVPRAGSARRRYSFSVPPAFGCHFISRFSATPTSASRASANAVSTRMPAITVLMSNAPSACRIR